MARSYRDDDGSPGFASVLQFDAAVRAAAQIEERVRRLFPEVRRRAPLAGAAEITEAEWSAFRELVCGGVAPHTAAQLAFGATPRQFRSWMAEGASQATGVPRAFYDAVRAVQCQARGVAESRVFVENPEAWLQRGPGGRTLPDDPGWSDERLVKHADPSGERPPSVRLVFTRRGPEVQLNTVPDDETLPVEGTEVIESGTSVPAADEPGEPDSTVDDED